MSVFERSAEQYPESLRSSDLMRFCQGGFADYVALLITYIGRSLIRFCRLSDRFACQFDRSLGGRFSCKGRLV